MTEDIRNIRKFINEIKSLSLGKGIARMRELILMMPWLTISEQLSMLERDYNLMLDIMLRGYKDESRPQMYSQMQARLLVIACNAMADAVVRQVPTYTTAKNKANSICFDKDSITDSLQGFVQEMAILSLSSNPSNPSNPSPQSPLYKSHQDYLDKLFSYILTGHNWTAEEAAFMSELLASPTIDSMDVQLIVSAVTLSALTVPDINKVRCLTSLYTTTSDENVRQRALVGWVLTACANTCFGTMLSDIIHPLLKESEVRNDLLELSMQLYYSSQTEEYNSYITNTIVPDIMKHSDASMRHLGLGEKDDDTPIEDILDSGAEDRRMEEMEQSVRKMMDMEMSGVDIYFGGFKQMKRFPFFYTLSNWFMPFYFDHPAIARIVGDIRHKQLMSLLIDAGSMCNSDKYSLIHAMSSVFARMPDDVVEKMNETAGTSMPQFGQRNTPAYIRRIYLQDLLRFYKVYPQKQDFTDVFDTAHNFLALPPFEGMLHDEVRKYASFLLKRKKNPAALFSTVFDDTNLEDKRLMALVSMKNGNYGLAHKLFSEIAVNTPEDYNAVRGAASASFKSGDYTEAAKWYGMAIAMEETENLRSQLNYSVSMIYIGKVADAANNLYRLSFDYPDNTDIQRALAYAQLRASKPEQALKLYDRLMAAEDNSYDKLNAAYCHMRLGQWREAVLQLKAFLAMDGTSEDDILSDQALLHELGISRRDIMMAIDLATIHPHQGQGASNILTY